MCNAWFDHVIHILLAFAADAREQRARNPTDFSEGVLQGYRDALCTVKHTLSEHSYDLSRCGLDIDIEDNYS